jgi:rubrerythrin
MALVQNSQDVFEIALRMEKIGKDFYEALAVASDDEAVRQFCAKAAADEARHYETFCWMREHMKRRGPKAAPDAVRAHRLECLVKEQIQPDPAAVQKVAIGGRLKDALAMAIAMEQDAVKFYQGLLGVMPDLADPLKAIVEEENEHLRDLLTLEGASREAQTSETGDQGIGY